MPAPVQFNVSLAPLPSNVSYTPAEFAQAIIDRVTVAPVDPWSAFQVIDNPPGTAPTADYGPVLLKSGSGTYSGKTMWHYWDAGTSTYKHVDLDGAKLINSSVPVASLANWAAPGNILYANASLVPTQLTSVGTTDGQVLTITTDAGNKKVVWADTFIPAASGNHFEITVSPAQVINTGGVAETIEFNAVRLDPTSSFDTANYRWPVAENEVWFFYAQVQLSDSGAATTNWNAQLDIRRDGVATNGIGAYLEAAAMGTFNLAASGVMKIGPGAAYVDASLTVNGTGADIQIEANVTNTKFGGFRIL